MIIGFADEAWEDYQYWSLNDKNIFKRINLLIKDIKRNPKRMQREAKKQMQETGIGTKSQQALKLQQEQNKQERKVRSREKKEADELRMFELKQQKKREKHRGH